MVVSDCETLSHCDERYEVRLQLHGAIYLPYSFVLMLRYCANLKAIRYELTTLNRIVADKSHRVIIAWCDLSSRFFCIDATSLSEFESDKICVPDQVRTLSQVGTKRS